MQRTAPLRSHQDLHGAALLDDLAGRRLLLPAPCCPGTSSSRPPARRPAARRWPLPGSCPMTSGTVTCGRPADTVMVTALPKGCGPSAGPGVTAMTSPTSTAALRPSSPRVTVKPAAVRLLCGLLGRLAGDVGDGDRRVARADDHGDDLVPLEVGPAGGSNADDRPRGDVVVVLLGGREGDLGQALLQLRLDLGPRLRDQRGVDPEALRTLGDDEPHVGAADGLTGGRLGGDDRARGQLLAPLLLAAVGIEPGLLQQVDGGALLRAEQVGDLRSSARNRATSRRRRR